MISLEFTTTACNRSALLEQTYRSYCSNLKGIDFKKSTLYINIDPTPNNKNILLVEKVASKYFGNVIANYPSVPNFAKAIKWCFSQPTGTYFFHLEDDWKLLKKIDIANVISKINESTLQCVLNKKFSSLLIQEIEEPSFVPSLFVTKKIQRYLPHMNDLLNPEYQIKLLFRKKVEQVNLDRSVLFDKKNEISRDIGRAWLRKNGLTRSYSDQKKWSPWITWKKIKP